MTASPERFHAARRDPTVAVLEGFHAVKHALRFGAELLACAAADREQVDALAEALAPDVRAALRDAVTVGEPGAFALPRTGVVAIARRPLVDVGAALGDAAPAPVVLLEDPRRLDNVGACVRVAAAAGAAAVLTTGTHDPWHPDALRGAAGLHFALPVARVDTVPPSDRPLVAVDPDGDALDVEALPPRAVLAFGTERHGLSDALLARADARVALPMRPGVSSLNLATAVSAVLYAWRLTPPRG